MTTYKPYQPKLDVTAMKVRIDAATWMVLPGRQTAHAVGQMSGGRWTGYCGSCGAHHTPVMRAPMAFERRCEQCLVALCHDQHGGLERFFVGRMSAGTRTERRQAWRAYRETMTALGIDVYHV